MKTKQFLILLLMVFTGWLTPANAADVTVYAKYSATPYIHVWNTGSGGTTTSTPVAMTSWTDSSGVTWYKKTLTVESSTTNYGFLFAKDSGWNNKIGGDQTNNIGDVAFDLTSGNPVRVPVPDADLYLIGDTYGWGSAPTEAMTRNGSTYTWTGTINGKFALVDTGIFVDWSSFNNHRWASNNTTVSEGNTYNFTDNGDVGSTISSGEYTFTYDALTRKLTIEAPTADPALYLVGTRNSWTFGEDQFTGTDPTFTYTADFSLNEEFGFKDENQTWIAATIPAANEVQKFWIEGVDYSNVELEESTGKNFLVKIPGNYIITVNKNTLIANIVCNSVVDEWWLRGTFKGVNNWSSGASFADNGDGTFTITQDLQAGDELKFYNAYSDSWFTYTDPIGTGVTDKTWSGSATANLSIAVAGRWTFVINPLAGTFSASVDTSLADGYYFVSELSNNEKWECFRLSPSRNRNGGPNSAQFYTFHVQDFLMDAQHNSQNTTYTALHWYIESTDGTKYCPYSTDQNYELGSYDITHNNKGEGVIYQTYGVQATAAGDAIPAKFMHTKNYADSESFTVFFNNNYTNGGNDAEVSILINPEGNYCGKLSENEDGYYLIGNFGNADASVSLQPWNPDFRRKMSKYYYKDGLQYTSEIASADSLVYRVTVERPAEGWKNLYLAIFPSSNIITDNTEWPDDGTMVNNWKQAIRPQVQWYNGTDNSGLDGTARRGGLFSRRSDSDDTQQALNPQVSDDYKSYTFSMNETTSTYNIVFNKQLFLMGPAVSTDATHAVASSNADDSAASTAAWSSEHPALQTDHALLFIRHSADNSYRYYGGDDEETTEQKVHLVQGQRMAFVWDKNFQDAFYAEDDVAPVELVDASGNLNINAYSKASSDHGNFDTQFVNYLSIYALPKSDFDPAVDYDINYLTGDKEYDVDGQRFNLPTGDYYIRLYITTMNEQQYVYYVVSDREYDFYAPGATTRGIKEAVFGFNEKASMRTFSDYHAVVIPSGIDVYYLSNATHTANTNKGVVTLTEYPLQTSNGVSRILPANTPVMLVVNQAASAFKTTFPEKFEYYGENPKLEGPSLTNLMKPSVAAQTVAKHEGTEYDNFLFGYKLLEGDDKFSVGFFHPGSGTFSINSAYLQVAYDFLGDVINDGRYFAFGNSETTAIDAIETTAETMLQGQTVYDMQGRVMPAQGQLPKGIYVVNGKKFVVK